MSYLNNIEINIFAFVLLVILFINTYQRGEALRADQRLFNYMIATVALLLVFDTIQWGVDGRPGRDIYYINLISITLYYMCNALPCYFWCLYARYQLTMNANDTTVRILLAVPAFIGIVLSALSCFSRLFFYIDENNVYHRGEYYWFFLVIIMAYLLYALFYIIANRKKVEKAIYYSLLIFALPPFIGGAVQALFYGVSLVWPGAALSLLIIYIYVQKSQLHTDHLTGLYNRRRLDAYLERSLAQAGHNGIGCILLDIDGFKAINDTHGHAIGDQALIDLAGILKQSVGRESFLARYGGDEFVVILHAGDSASVEKTVNAININVASYNLNSEAPYEIRLSVGYDVFHNVARCTREHVLHHIDTLMYQNKKNCRIS